MNQVSEEYIKEALVVIYPLLNLGRGFTRIFQKNQIGIA